MKIKKDWEKAYDSKLPADARERILAAAKAKLGESEAAPSLLAMLTERFWLPAAGGAVLAAGVAAVFLLRGPSVEDPAAGASALAFRYPPAMVRDAEMLYDLRVIRNRSLLEKIEKRKWPKKRT